jgi:hypothetical protein
LEVLTPGGPDRLHPVTDAAQDTDSYLEFAEGPFLFAKSMAWFWDAYCPDDANR